MFDGVISEGFPVFGILYRLPRIYIGRFTVPNKSNYKFIYKKTELFLKCMRYSIMLQTFSLEGEIHNYVADVEYISGLFPFHRTLLEGIYYLRSREGKVYIGSMKNSMRHGFGLMLLPNSHSMIGEWSKGFFKGIYRCPPVNQERNPMFNSQIPGVTDSGDHKKTYSKRSVSHYESVKRISSFNKNPVEVRGTFSITGDKLTLVDHGNIIFQDGSVYVGEISNNRMSGFGSMRYATGESYEGLWRHNQPNGVGKLNGINYEYEGQFKNGLWQGFGILRLLAEQKTIKGEWEKGKLRFALIDEVASSSSLFQIDRMHISVTEELNLFRTGKIELTGVCHVLFKDKNDRSTSPSSHFKGGIIKTLPNEQNEYKQDSVAGSIKGEGESDDGKSVKIVPSQTGTYSPTHHRMSVHSRIPTKPYQFIGIFKHNEWSDIEGFPLHQTIGVGYLIKGSEVVFKGIASYEFDKFFGVRYDHETETELKGHFNGYLRMTGLGESTRGDVQYFGTFKKNQKSGLIKKTQAGQDVFIAEYEDDKKNGFVLKFQSEAPLLAEYHANK